MPSLERVLHPIPYDVHRRRRRTLEVTVRDDGRVEVLAPLRTSRARIEALIEENLDWIRATRREHRARYRRLRTRRLDDGESIPYLGGNLRLVLRESGEASMRVPYRVDDDLIVHISVGLATGSRRAATRSAVGLWLLGEAQGIFHECHGRAARRVGDAAESVTIKDMRTRWGSCGLNRKMSLSWRLVMAPVHVIDYVLVHELTHIRIPDHSARFWKHVAQACPRWEEGVAWLKEHGDNLEL